MPLKGIAELCLRTDAKDQHVKRGWSECPGDPGSVRDIVRTDSNQG